ncbi:MAG: hypothetical protein IKB00_07355, partial [Bacteroidaceae bacterium]|nr:hypothetical protein [Bacteroidaceae bacterium]
TANADGADAVLFKGSGWGLLPDRKYYAYFPYVDKSSPVKATGTYTATLTQTADNATSHLSKNIFMYTSATTPQDGNKASFNLHHLGSIMKIEVTVPQEAQSATFKKAEISLADSLFIEKFQYNPTADAPALEAVTTTNLQTLNLNFTPVEGKLSLWLLVGEVDLSGKQITIQLTGGTGLYEGTFTGANQVRGKAHLYETTVAKGGSIPDSEFYVDLGLPSGIKWAKCNLTVGGFAYPVDETVLGDYYGWGETEPYYTSLTKNGENATVTATWKSGYDGYTSNSYAKNTSRGSYTAAGQQLSLADDAANATLGGNWRMPTIANLTELANNCTFASATVNNVKGVKVTSNINGNYIFLPSNGYITGTTFKGWTSNSPGARFWLADCAGSDKAYQQYTAEGSPAVNYDQAKDKFRGTPIRPVYVP